MNAPIAKNQLDFTLGNLSYIDHSYEEYDEAPASVVKPHRHGLGGWLAGCVAGLAEWHRRRAVMEEMALMTDRELSDIGLTRADVGRVFDPAFVSDHARGRDYIAY